MPKKNFKDMTNKERQAECDNCRGRRHPAGDYCQGCNFRGLRH